MKSMISVLSISMLISLASFANNERLLRAVVLIPESSIRHNDKNRFICYADFSGTTHIFDLASPYVLPQLTIRQRALKELLERECRDLPTLHCLLMRKMLEHAELEYVKISDAKENFLSLPCVICADTVSESPATTLKEPGIEKVALENNGTDVTASSDAPASDAGSSTSAESSSAE